MEIYTKNIHYDIEEDMLGRVNIIQGDSGTGKSVLVDLATAKDIRTVGTTCTGKYPIYIHYQI